MTDPIDSDNLNMLQKLVPLLRENGVETFEAGGMKLTFSKQAAKTLDSTLKDAMERLRPRPDVQDEPKSYVYEDFFGEPQPQGSKQ